MRCDFVVVAGSEFAGREVIEIATVCRSADGTQPLCNARVVAFVPGSEECKLRFAREIADALNEKRERDREASRAAAELRKAEEKAHREQSAGEGK